MEDYYIDIVIGEGQDYSCSSAAAATIYSNWGNDFSWQLSAPLRDRFGIVEHMQYYTIDELEQIVLRSSDVFHTSIAPEAAHELHDARVVHLVLPIAYLSGCVILRS